MSDLLAVVLDTGPLGIATQRKSAPEAAACARWLFHLQEKGIEVLIPEIADYELRRELIRSGKQASIKRLDRLCQTNTYLRITTEAMRLAARYWADVRNAGTPTADNKALDGDVILAAQVGVLRIPPDQIVVATSNPKHLARFVPARRWQEIGVEDEREVGDGNGTA